MKKLFTLAFSTLMVLGVAACGTTNYDETVLEDKEHSFLATGQWANWGEGLDGTYKMKATSVKAVSEYSKDVANKLAKKSLKYLYTLDVKLEEGASWKAKAKVNGKVEEFDGNFAIKCVICSYNSEEKTYAADHWLPNPADTDPGHVEALTDNVFMPTYQKEADPDGFSWSDNPVVTSGAGTYHFVVAQYTTVSSATAVGYGFGAVKL